MKPNAPPAAGASLFLCLAVGLLAGGSGMKTGVSSGATRRVSVASDGGQAGSASGRASLSADGRFVAFVSSAANLVPGKTNTCPNWSETISCSDVFVHDRVTRLTTRVSVATDGTQANGPSQSPVLSVDGRFIAFSSTANNLAGSSHAQCANGYLGTQTCWSVHLHDRLMGITTRVSNGWDGSAPNGRSVDPAISPDGRYVAFASTANNLVPNVAEGCLAAPHDLQRCPNIYLFDTRTGEASLISASPQGLPGDGWSESPSVSNESRFIAFQSRAANLAPGAVVGCPGGPSNGCSSILVYDRRIARSVRVSQLAEGTPGDGDSVSPRITPDGRYIAFTSAATNLVGDDTNVCRDMGVHLIPGSCPDVFVHDRETATTTRVSVAFDGAGAGGASAHPSISADGRSVAFISFATNLVDGDTNVCNPDQRLRGSCPDVFVHDVDTKRTVRISVSAEGVQGDLSSESVTAISGDGRVVAFHSAARNLVFEDTNEADDVFVHDRGGGEPILDLYAAPPSCLLRHLSDSCSVTIRMENPDRLPLQLWGAGTRRCGTPGHRPPGCPTNGTGYSLDPVGNHHLSSLRKARRVAAPAAFR